MRDAEPAWSRGSPSPAADYGFWPLCILLEAGEAALWLLCEIGAGFSPPQAAGFPPKR